jgi:uncharacterized protein YhfF
MEYTIWKDYLEHLEQNGIPKPEQYLFAEHFCNDRASADKLYQLAIDGKKKATTGSIWAYEYDKEPILNPGDLTILTNYDSSRACVIRTKKVIIKKYKEITEEEARKEGEGDLSLGYWRRVHKEYFEEECLRIGKEFSEEMPVAFEEFEIAYKNDKS